MTKRLHARIGTEDITSISNCIDIIGGCETQFLSEYLVGLGFHTNSSYLDNIASDPYIELLNDSSIYRSSESKVILLSQIQRLTYAYIDIEFHGNNRIPSLKSFLNETINQLEYCIKELQKVKTCEIYLLTPINYYSPSLGYYDYRNISYWSKHEFTMYYKIELYKLSRKYPNVYILDSDVALEREGKSPLNNKENIRLYENKGGHVERNGAEIIAEELIYQLFINSKNIKRIKCIILDIDNTLWKGIFREDGPDNIKVDPSYMFRIYRLITLYQRGIMLCLCSKNDEEDTKAIFNLLRKYYGKTYAGNFVDMVILSKINWLPKSENIKSIAKELNIGLDSIAFFDDSSYERNEVSQNLPAVRTFSDKDILIAPDLPIFQPFGRLSKESLQRNEKYKDDIQRKIKENESISNNNFEKFLFDSSMVIKFKSAEKFELVRISEILQRTNQMNATLKRMNESDVLQHFEKDKILVMYLTDSFGDYGLIGCCLYSIVNSILYITEFALSCRAMGRKIEDAFIQETIGIAKDNDCKKISITITQNSRNKNFISILENNGFFSTNEEHKSNSNSTETKVMEIGVQQLEGRKFPLWFKIER